MSDDSGEDKDKDPADRNPQGLETRTHSTQVVSFKKIEEIYPAAHGSSSRTAEQRTQVSTIEPALKPAMESDECDARKSKIERRISFSCSILQFSFSYIVIHTLKRLRHAVLCSLERKKYIGPVKLKVQTTD